MSLIDYTDIKNEVESAEEPKTLKAGEECRARIIAVNSGTSDKNDCEWFMPSFDVPDDPMVKEFGDFHWVLDKSKLSDKEYARSLYKFQQFAKAFSIDLSRPFDLEDLIGSEGWVIVGVRKSEYYGEQNTVRKYVAGR